jgi:hypothetical protein
MTPFPSTFSWLFYFAMNGVFVSKQALDGLPFEMSSGIFKINYHAIKFNFALLNPFLTRNGAKASRDIEIHTKQRNCTIFHTQLLRTRISTEINYN